MIYKRKWALQNKTRLKAQRKIWEETHKDEIRKKKAAYRLAHLEHIKARDRRYYQNMKEKKQYEQHTVTQFNEIVALHEKANEMINQSTLKDIPLL